MDATGLNDESFDQVENLTRARNLPSFQLAGYPDRRDIDLNALCGGGVKIVGRVAGVRAGKLQLSGSLRNVCALADLKMNRLLNTFDQWATERGVDNEIGPVHRFAPTQVDAAPRFRSICRRATFVRCFGPPGSVQTTHGSMYRCSTTKATSCTKVAS